MILNPSNLIYFNFTSDLTFNCAHHFRWEQASRCHNYQIITIVRFSNSIDWFLISIELMCRELDDLHYNYSGCLNLCKLWFEFYNDNIFCFFLSFGGNINILLGYTGSLNMWILELFLHLNLRHLLKSGTYWLTN